MRIWTLLYTKELKDFWQSYKWMWVPLVFILLGISQPLSTYYMPQIMELAGVPKGAVGQIPVPSATEVLVKVLSQYSLIGVLILVLAGMTIISAERTTGQAQLILIRPVSHFSFVSSKWFAFITLTLTAFFLGYAASWFYTDYLIGNINFGDGAIAFILYFMWLMFILTLTIFFSAIFRSGGVIAFLTLGVSSLLSILTSTFSKYMMWSPSRLVNQADSYLLTGKMIEHLFFGVVTSLIIMGMLLFFSVMIFKTHDLSIER